LLLVAAVARRLVALIAIFAHMALLLLRRLDGFGADRLAVVAIFVAVAIIVEVIGIVAILAILILLLALTLALLLEAGAAFGEHAEIMIRELEIIFGHHPVALGLGVPREIAVFLVELDGVAARPIVDPVASIGTVGVRSPHLRAAAATATAVLPIVDQRFRVLVPGG